MALAVVTSQANSVYQETQLEKLVRDKGFMDKVLSEPLDFRGFFRHRGIIQKECAGRNSENTITHKIKAFKTVLCDPKVHACANQYFKNACRKAHSRSEQALYLLVDVGASIRAKRATKSAPATPELRHFRTRLDIPKQKPCWHYQNTGNCQYNLWCKWGHPGDIRVYVFEDGNPDILPGDLRIMTKKGEILNIRFGVFKHADFVQEVPTVPALPSSAFPLPMLDPSFLLFVPQQIPFPILMPIFNTLSYPALMHAPSAVPPIFAATLPSHTYTPWPRGNQSWHSDAL